jgi:ABC-type phosphate/phosphonate transport system substrate-binding protein
MATNALGLLVCKYVGMLWWLMRKPIPSHGQLDHCFLKQQWDGQPIKRTPVLFSVGTPEQLRETLRQAMLTIDSINKKQPLFIPMEDIEL